MKKATLMKTVAMLSSATLLFGVGSVYASWSFAIGDVPEEVSNLEISYFEWVGGEELPTTVGSNHIAFIENIIKGVDGLNAGSNSYINKQIRERKNNTTLFGIPAPKDTFGSTDYWDKAGTSETFNTDTQNVTFLMYFPNPFTDENNDGKDDVDESESVQYLFTTSVDLGEGGYSVGSNRADLSVPIGEYIYIIYRTTIVNLYGTWTATETEIGYAKSAYYDNNLAGSLLSQMPSFDATSWEAGKRGTGLDDAVYSHVHKTISADSLAAGVPSVDGYLTTEHIVHSPKETVYYQYTPSTSKNYTIAVNTSKATAILKLYDSTGAEIQTQTVTENGVTRLTWYGRKDTKYYFSLSGATTFNFTLY